MMRHNAAVRAASGFGWSVEQINAPYIPFRIRELKARQTRIRRLRNLQRSTWLVAFGLLLTAIAISRMAGYNPL
jgi:hypothetical protein